MESPRTGINKKPMFHQRSSIHYPATTHSDGIKDRDDMDYAEKESPSVGNILRDMFKDPETESPQNLSQPNTVESREKEHFHSMKNREKPSSLSTMFSNPEENETQEMDSDSNPMYLQKMHREVQNISKFALNTKVNLNRENNSLKNPSTYESSEKKENIAINNMLKRIRRRKLDDSPSDTPYSHSQSNIDTHPSKNLLKISGSLNKVRKTQTLPSFFRNTSQNNRKVSASNMFKFTEQESPLKVPKVSEHKRFSEGMRKQSQSSNSSTPLNLKKLAIKQGAKGNARNFDQENKQNRTLNSSKAKEFPLPALPIFPPDINPKKSANTRNQIQSNAFVDPHQMAFTPPIHYEKRSDSTKLGTRMTLKTNQRNGVNNRHQAIEGISSDNFHSNLSSWSEKSANRLSFPMFDSPDENIHRNLKETQSQNQNFNFQKQRYLPKSFSPSNNLDENKTNFGSTPSNYSYRHSSNDSAFSSNQSIGENQPYTDIYSDNYEQNISYEQHERDQRNQNKRNYHSLSQSLGHRYHAIKPNNASYNENRAKYWGRQDLSPENNPEIYQNQYQQLNRSLERNHISPQRSDRIPRFQSNYINNSYGRPRLSFQTTRSKELSTPGQFFSEMQNSNSHNSIQTRNQWIEDKIHEISRTEKVKNEIMAILYNSDGISDANLLRKIKQSGRYMGSVTLGMIMYNLIDLFGSDLISRNPNENGFIYNISKEFRSCYEKCNEIIE